MSISYSGLTNYGKATLPSVSGWGTDMNILRDPPKSIHTRRINRVGETSNITDMVDASGDRNCEAISVYARGVNPFVSVSYSNDGNNGGNRSGGLVAGGQKQAYLPYGTAKDGAFRPPVLTQEQTMPLSRQPRIWTDAFTNPGFPDFSKKMMVCNTDTDFREVKKEILNVSVRPTAVYRVETPLKEPYEVKYVIQPTLHTSANSGIRTMDRTTLHVGNPSKVIHDNALHAFAQSSAGMSSDRTVYQHQDPSNGINYDNIHAFANVNAGASSDQTVYYGQDPSNGINYENIHAFANANVSQDKYINQSEFDPERYLQDTNAHSAGTNPSANRQTTPIDEIFDISDLPTKDIRTVNYTTAVSGNEQNRFEHTPIHLERSLPEYSATTNYGQNIYKAIEADNSIELSRNMPIASWESNPVRQGSSDHGSRTYNLAPKIQAGSFMIPGQIPMENRMQNVQMPRETERSRMSRAVLEQQLGRFDH